MRLLASLAMFSGVAVFAAEPVGTASGSAPFDVNGVATRSEGVFSWPVLAGDDVQSVTAPVVIRFHDGSRITISERSQVKLAGTGDTISVNLTRGEARFSLTEQSKLQILSMGQKVGVRSGAISTRPPAGGGTQIGAPRGEIRPPPPPISSQ